MASTNLNHKFKRNNTLLIVLLFCLVHVVFWSVILEGIFPINVLIPIYLQFGIIGLFVAIIVAIATVAVLYLMIKLIDGLTDPLD